MLKCYIESVPGQRKIAFDLVNMTNQWDYQARENSRIDSLNMVINT